MPEDRRFLKSPQAILYSDPDSQFKNLVEDCTSADFFGSFTLKLPTGENCELLGVDTHCENRFGKTTKTEDFDALIKDQKSGNTERSTKWATSVFELGDPFVVEARKQDGSPYPPGSLYNIACGLLRNLRSSGIYDKNFLDETNADTRGSASTRCSDEKADKGWVRYWSEEAKPVNEEDEKILWSKGVFGNSSSVALQHTMYFYNCLEGRYTNHSGKKTCATTLYQGGIPEEEIMNDWPQIHYRG
ncbi:uncharacterized protein LOC128557398 [Mercenaria mercenaria]|uniref:uncharacterized protein LOC128557398 n=1 Tax=Mercenaria mercenaria TaxID=6596 RepID=UPI00234EFD39|nr:uncharacterized protein LOC128557398 [Mercenaria mercenaria]